MCSAVSGWDEDYYFFCKSWHFIYIQLSREGKGFSILQYATKVYNLRGWHYMDKVLKMMIWYLALSILRNQLRQDTPSVPLFRSWERRFDAKRWYSCSSTWAGNVSIGIWKPRSQIPKNAFLWRWNIVPGISSRRRRLCIPFWMVEFRHDIMHLQSGSKLADLVVDTLDAEHWPREIVAGVSIP